MDIRTEKPTKEQMLRQYVLQLTDQNLCTDLRHAANLLERHNLANPRFVEALRSHASRIVKARGLSLFNLE